MPVWNSLPEFGEQTEFDMKFNPLYSPSVKITVGWRWREEAGDLQYGTTKLEWGGVQEKLSN